MKLRLDEYYYILNINYGWEEIEEAFEKYEAKGFFEIDMKYVKEEFVTDVELDLQLLKSLREQWFGKDKLESVFRLFF